jgi:hypothetical protein
MKESLKTNQSVVSRQQIYNLLAGHRKQAAKPRVETKNKKSTNIP